MLRSVLRSVRRTRFDRVQVYRTLRSAHLERARAIGATSVLYRSRRADFDEALAEGLDLVRAGPWATAATLLASRVRTVEVNEPLMLPAARQGVLTVLAARLSGALHRVDVRVVAYAIENRDPRASPAPTARRRLRRSLDLRAARFLARHVDRIAYGTTGAAHLYADLLPGTAARGLSRVVEALPAPCDCPPGTGARPGSVLFLGALEERKGFHLLARAWPQVLRSHPAATLAVVGTGPLAGLAHETARNHPGVSVLVDPPRAEVHRQLRRAAVLVLPSQRTPTWREQVGLPLVEGLAHGCLVVTTAESGIAPWLAGHGHVVLDPAVDAAGVAAAVVAALGSARTGAEVLADLPAQDGRRAADAWLHAPAVDPPGADPAAVDRRRRRSRRV
ncbi:hypothetical protein GCM10023225_22890 [Kineococcus glutinatus]|uniref:Glycosyltransferase involved in cell wall biosynthesis n=1 Tax=Kineococcus glutinatus TaxID=1070872 RepID=A0ABP9HYQ8_9ACTN